MESMRCLRRTEAVRCSVCQGRGQLNDGPPEPSVEQNVRVVTTDPTNAAIIIRRPWKLRCSIRQFAVFIDETKVGGVYNGAEARFEVTPDRHSVYIKLDLWNSKPCVLDLQPGQSASLVCGLPRQLVAWISPGDYLSLS